VSRIDKSRPKQSSNGWSAEEREGFYKKRVEFVTGRKSIEDEANDILNEEELLIRQFGEERYKVLMKVYPEE
jgi:hypothetical protein